MDTLIPVEDKTNLRKLSLPSNNFVSSYSVAHQIVTNAVTSHQAYWDIIKACEEHIDGKKPNIVDELIKRGMAWASNFNYGKARAKQEKGTAENCARVSSALSLGYVTFRNSKDEDKKDPILSFLLDSEKRGIVASNIGMALASTLAKETRLSGWLNEIENPSYAYGYCALSFDTFDWMPTPIHPLNIAFKPRTKPDDIRTWITFKTVEASELFDRWIEAYNESITVDESENKPKRIASSGWNLEGLEEVLLNAYQGQVGKEGQRRTPNTWSEVVPMYEQNPSAIIMDTQSITVAKIYHRELNGNLTETYIPYNNTWQASGSGRKNSITGAPSPEFAAILFNKSRGVFNQGRFINLVRDSGYTSGDNYIQNLRGIAKYSVEDSIRYNRNRNAMNNKMVFAGSPMFEQSTTGSGDKFKITVSQGFLLLPPSHNLIERQPTFDVASHINVLNFEEREFNRDTQQFDASIQGKLTSRPNKGEVQQVTEEVKFTDAAKNNVKFRDYACVFFNVLLRLPSVNCKVSDKGYEGKERFYETVKKNLPWLVKTNADINKLLKCIDSFVLDPVTNNLETITIALQMAETPYARNRLKRMMLIAKGMPIEEVNTAIPLTADKFTNLQDSRVAAFENDMFFTTNEIIITGTDDHIIHNDSHLSKCDRVIKGVQSGALSPIDAFKYLENNLAHVRNHIDMLGQDPMFNDKAQEYDQIWNQFIMIKNKIKQEAQAMMEQKAQQDGQINLDPEVESRIASKNAEAQANTARKDWLAEQRTGQADKRIDLDHEKQMRKIELEAQTKTRNQ